MKMEQKCEDFTRMLFEKGKEILELAKEEDLEPGINTIDFDVKGGYVNVTVRTDHGTYDMYTINGSAPRLGFREK